MGNLTLERTEVPIQAEATTVPAPRPARPPRASARALPPDTEAAGAEGGKKGWFRRRHPLVWIFRLPIALPFVFMGPEIASVALGRPGAVANVSASAADVLGTSSLLLFLSMLTVTPLHTVTGWRWHRPLRRDYGLAMFAVAMTDLVCAATATADTFPGGLFTRIAGHTFLVAGTLSTLLLVPLAITGNRRAQRWLGPHWKSLHRLVYVIWATVLLHLAFLFGFRTIFVDALLVSAPLVLLRIPAVRDCWAAARKARSHRALRWTGLLALSGVYAAGYVPLVTELFHKGLAAFAQHPAA